MNISGNLPPRVALYREIEAEYIANLEHQGVRFAAHYTDEAAKSRLVGNLAQRGALVRNGGASISINGLSSACLACTGARGSKTFQLSLRCDRQCYFCFNPNQQDYDMQRKNINNWRKELDDFSALGVVVSHIALTGGEPLIHKEETIQFFETVRARYPLAHTRLYTTGDRLDVSLLETLHKARLTEIRFSIKMEDSPEMLEHTLECIALACKYIPQVMVEMPVIPNTIESMCELLDRLNAYGIFGINLLELCFPLHNWHEFEERGFVIKNPPFPVLYDYRYAGGLPVSESEKQALELLSYALDQKMTMGIHYCSLENKHRDEIYQLNMPYADAFEMYQLDLRDYFLKTILVFNENADRLRPALINAGLPYEEVIEDHALQFNPSKLGKVLLLNCGTDFYVSDNIAVLNDNELTLRELKLTELLL